VIGARAVDRLLAELGTPAPNADATRQQAGILQALERIGDARAVDAALVLLDGGPVALHHPAIAILRTHVQARRSAVATRVLERLTSLVLDPRRPAPLRLAALEAVQDLPAALIAPLLERLRADQDPVIRRHAGAAPETLPASPAGTDAVGPDGESLLDTLPTDPAVVHERVVAAGADVPLLVLHRLVVAVRAREEECARDEERRRWTLVRAAAHQALGARGSRVALYDLRETVVSAKTPLPIGMLAALVAVGDATCLEPIADAYARIDDGWHRDRLAEALRAIVKRERLSRRHAAVRKVAARLPPGLLTA
jgi:hypothetical protein